MVKRIRLQSDHEIHYRLIDGDGGRPCLIFLHEGLGSAAMWKDFPDRLCRLTTCPGLVYDRSGHGQSSPLRRTRTVHYLHEYALSELSELLEKVIPGQPYILIGHSDGGSISLILGAERHDLLVGIITEAAHVFVEQESLNAIEAAEKNHRKGLFRGLARYHGEKTEAVFRAWADTWRAEWFNYWNIKYLLPSIACPVLVMQGRQDAYGTDRQVETIVAKTAGQVTPVFIENCGHAPHQEQPEKVLGILAEYINGLRYGVSSKVLRDASTLM